MAFDMISFLAKQANKVDLNTGQLGRQGVDTYTLPAFFKTSINIWNCRIKTYKEYITGTDTLIFDHPTYGILDTSRFGQYSGFILGHNSYGVLGSNVLGDTTDNLLELISVSNDLNLFYEGFYNTRFVGTTNTAYLDITNEALRMSSSTNKAKVYNKTFISSEVYLGTSTVTSIEFNCEEYKWGNDLIKYYVKTNNNPWQEVQLGIETELNYPGTSLFYKVVFFGNGAYDTYIKNVYVEYIF